jgi:hypothetical protein
MKVSQANRHSNGKKPRGFTNEEFHNEARLYREIAKKNLDEIRLYREFAKKSADEIALLYARVFSFWKKSRPNC